MQHACGSRLSGSTVKFVSRVTSPATFSASAGAENSSYGLDTLFFILHICCVIVSTVGVDLIGLKPSHLDLSSFSALTLLAGSFDL